MCGNERLNLQALTFHLAKKFKKGGVSGGTKLSYKYQIQIALIVSCLNLLMFKQVLTTDFTAPLHLGNHAIHRIRDTKR